MLNALRQVLRPYSRSIEKVRRKPRRPLLCERLEQRELMAGDIDSILGIGTDLGRSMGHDVATDAAGNTYIAGTLDNYYDPSDSDEGSTAPIDIDPAHSYSDNRDIVSVPESGSAAYFAKYLPDGTVDWVVQAAHSHQRIWQTRIAIAPTSGGIYIAGLYGGTLTVGSHVLPRIGSYWSRFAGKIDLDGTVAWAKGYQAANPDLFQGTTGLAVDELRGRLFVSGVQKLASSGYSSGTVIALNFADTQNVQVAWKADLATSYGAKIVDTTVDSVGGVITVGSFQGNADFDPGPGSTTLSSGGGKSPPVASFIWKLNGNGTFGWVKQFQAGKNSSWDATAVAIDPTDSANSIYVAGNFTGTVDFQPGTGIKNMTSTSGANAYLVKMSSAGMAAFASQYGGGGDQVSRSIAFDAAGVYLLGGDGNPDGRLSSVFVARFDKAAGTLAWQTTIRGQLNQYGAAQMDANGLAINSVTGQVHVLGWFKGPIEADGDVEPELNTGDATEDMFWLVLNAN